MKYLNKKKWMYLVIYLVIFVVCLYTCRSWFRIITTTAPDFSVYYLASERFWQKKLLYGQAFAFTGYGYPPQTALLYSPFLLFPYNLAQGVWITLSFLFIPIITLLTLKIIKQYIPSVDISFFSVALITSLFFLSFPTKFTLGMGQVNIVCLFLFLLFIYWELKNKEQLSGILFGISLFLKPQLGIFLILFFLYKKFTPFLFTFITCLSITVITVCIGGIEPLGLYLFQELPSLNRFVGRDVYYNQSIGGMLTRVIDPSWSQPLSLLIPAVLIAVSLFFLYKKRLPFGLAMIMFIPVFLLSEPVAWQHHYVMILPVFIVVSKLIKKLPLKIALLLSYICVSWNIKSPIDFSHSLIGNIMILSHTFWGGCILFIIILVYTGSYISFPKENKMV